MNRWTERRQAIPAKATKLRAIASTGLHRAATALSLGHTAASRLSRVRCRLLAQSGHSRHRTRVCPLLSNSGQTRVLARNGLSAFDPKRTIAVHCGNGFDVGFSPYQSTRLSRYNVVS